MSIADDIVALREAIASGVKSVREGNSMVEYPSFDDMKRRYDFLVDQRARENGSSRPNVILASFSHGR